MCLVDWTKCDLIIKGVTSLRKLCSLRYQWGFWVVGDGWKRYIFIAL